MLQINRTKNNYKGQSGYGLHVFGKKGFLYMGGLLFLDMLKHYRILNYSSGKA